MGLMLSLAAAVGGSLWPKERSRSAPGALLGRPGPVLEQLWRAYPALLYLKSNTKRQVDFRSPEIGSLGEFQNLKAFLNDIFKVFSFRRWRLVFLRNHFKIARRK